MDQEIKKETRGRKRGKFYVSNEDLEKEVKKYYETNVFSEQLGIYIKRIVDGVSHMPNFINYFSEKNPWGDEMYSDAIWKITKSIYDKKFIDTIQNENSKLDNNSDDPDNNKNNNLFAYFTRTAWNAFIGRIKKEQKNINDLNDYRDKVFEDYENEYGIPHQDEGEFKSENDW